MSAGFTPGPWVRDDDEEYSLILSGADGVCLMEGHTVGPFEPALREANASLIAAAPELYEALLLVSRNSGKLSNADWQMVEALLAKVRGEAL